MPMTGERTHTLVLTGDASIKNAKNIADSLLEALETHSSISIDTQTVSGADITTVQTLLSARVAARAQTKHLTMLTPIGAPLQSVLEQAGFLSPDQEHAGFWSSLSDQPAGH